MIGARVQQDERASCLKSVPGNGLNCQFQEKSPLVSEILTAPMLNEFVRSGRLVSEGLVWERPTSGFTLNPKPSNPKSLMSLGGHEVIRHFVSIVRMPFADGPWSERLANHASGRRAIVPLR